MSRKTIRFLPSMCRRPAPLHFSIRRQQHPERVNAERGSQDRIQQRDERQNQSECPSPRMALKEPPAGSKTGRRQKERGQTDKREESGNKVTDGPAPRRIVEPALPYHPGHPCAHQARHSAQEMKRRERDPKGAKRPQMPRYAS